MVFLSQAKFLRYWNFSKCGIFVLGKSFDYFFIVRIICMNLIFRKKFWLIKFFKFRKYFHIKNSIDHRIFFELSINHGNVSYLIIFCDYLIKSLWSFYLFEKYFVHEHLRNKAIDPQGTVNYIESLISSFTRNSNVDDALLLKFRK